ncbi:hypothetical protein ABIE50_005348 [Chitinophaga sp. OAE865]
MFLIYLCGILIKIQKHGYKYSSRGNICMAGSPVATRIAPVLIIIILLVYKPYRHYYRLAYHQPDVLCNPVFASWFFSRPCYLMFLKKR